MLAMECPHYDTGTGVVDRSRSQASSVDHHANFTQEIRAGLSVELFTFHGGLIAWFHKILSKYDIYQINKSDQEMQCWNTMLVWLESYTFTLDCQINV